MRCFKAIKLLQAYLDNELSDSEEKRLNHHLNGCSICRLELSALKKANEVLDSWEEIEPRRDMVTPIMEVIRHEIEAPNPIQRFLDIIYANRRKILAVGANFILLILVAINAPFFVRNPGNGLMTMTSPARPVDAPAHSIPTGYRTIDMTSSVNSMVDNYNLAPAERDMVIGNFLNDASEFLILIDQPVEVDERRATKRVHSRFNTGTGDEIYHRRIFIIQNQVIEER